MGAWGYGNFENDDALDWIYELDLAGNILTEYPHPYLAVEPPPEGSPYGVQSSGIARMPWAEDGRLAIGGGALRESGQPRIFALDKATGQPIPGTEMNNESCRDTCCVKYSLRVILNIRPGVSRIRYGGQSQESG